MSENGWKERQSGQRKQEIKGVNRIEKKTRRKDAKVRRKRREERKREQDKAYIKKTNI